MASLTQRRSQNIDGEFYVDGSCIDCDTCRWLTPAIFNQQVGQSAVYAQPTNETERRQALYALLACPTGSIGTVNKPTDIQLAQQDFPLKITENVFYCGYHSEKSYAAASYLIQHPLGNILVDSPRFTPPLVKQLEKMGGVRYLYLTHRDDVADHDKFRDHFGCDRILHHDEIGNNTHDVEIQLTGYDDFFLDESLRIIVVPGHTKGHTVLLYNNQFLFSGDHLAWSAAQQQLIAFRRQCWYSWTEQITSMEKLLNYQFLWVLPGHGRRYHGEANQAHQALVDCLAWMKQSA